MHRLLLPALALAALATPAMAQDTGGLELSPRVGRGPTGLARPLLNALPSITAADIQSSLKATDRTSVHQGMVARVRGDGGYLEGFAFGQPLAPSVQRPWRGGGYLGEGDGYGGEGIVVVNKFQAPVAITNGNGNVVQLQTANAGGPAAQQQVVTAGNNQHVQSGGAVNVITGDGNVVQHHE